MARDTENKLKNTALDLFSSQWYETVSVAEICRNAGVSNGVFYRYFPKKESLVRTLLDEFLNEFGEEIKVLEGNTREDQLLNFIEKIYNVGARHARQVAVFREGQYRLPEYEEKIREIYISVLSRIFGRPITQAEYLYIISGARFCSTRSLFNDLPRHHETICRLILEGVFPGTDEEIPSIPDHYFDYEEKPPAESRTRLLETGMRLIGSKGYHAIGVSDIARETDLAVGTFYTYFDKKEVFFSEIITLIGHRLRQFLSEHIQSLNSRYEQEILGIYYFLSYMNRHKEFYSIVREAEFVSKPWVREYYDKFERGYMKTLPMADTGDRQITANFLIGLSHYIGIEGLLNNRIADPAEFLKTMAGYLKRGVKL